MKKAILYSRYSSAQQSRGDTMRRQTEKGKAYAEKLGLELVEVTDRGVSAFKKKNNANSGNLSTLLTSAEAGLIPSGTILIVESLDRVSRQTPLDALEIFKRLLYAGLEIHTLIDRQIYTRESVDRDFFQLLGSLFVMQRAYDESRTKSERIKSSVKSRKKAVLEEGKLWRGSMPHWTRIDDDDTISIVENAANVVQRIFHLYLKGNGVSKICKLLNAEGIKSARGVKWEVKVVQDLLANPAVYGLLRIDGQEVENYYPQIISKEDFNRVQLQRARNTTTRGRRSVNHQNVFSGLLKCGKCGNSLYYTQMGSPSRNEQRYHTFRCGTKRNGSCDNSSLKFETFRTIFFEWFKDIDYRALNETEDEMSGLEKLRQYRESLEGERVQLDEREENYVDAIGRGQQIGIYAKKVDELHLERENLLKLTKDVDQQILVLENEEPLAPVELDGYEDFDQEQNEKLNMTLKAQVDSIHLTNERVRSNLYNREIIVHWRNGKESALFVQDSPTSKTIPDSIAQGGEAFRVTGLKSIQDAINQFPEYHWYLRDPRTEEIKPVLPPASQLSEEHILPVLEEHGLTKAEIKRVMKRLNSASKRSVRVDQL